MTVAATLTGAPSAPTNWPRINWVKVKGRVRRLQERIAKAVRKKRFGKVKAIQRLLTHSYSAKLLAVKRVTTNKGAKTPGVDGVTWNTKKKKEQAVDTLAQRGYRTQPLRRVYIPKANGKQRPLSIPVMRCRAMQALYLLALEPVTESLAEPNAYGFRPKRSTADAIGQCFNILARRHSPQWVLEGDIRSCFDKIRHEWLQAKIPTDNRILRKWLKAGYMEKNTLQRTTEGTPQGGIISPAILVSTLTGLAEAVDSAVAKRDKVHVVVYADDFVVTAASKEVLEHKVKPAIASFLEVRGLELSQEKTKITHIEEGFDFLGQNVRKYKGKMLIKPSKTNTKNFLRKIRATIKGQPTAKTENLIRQLNPMIRGWANFHRHVVAKATFSYVDFSIFQTLWRWSKRRHPKKGLQWIKARYFQSVGFRSWIFSTKVKDRMGKDKRLALVLAADVPIKRHVKIRGWANPYDDQYREYFIRRGKRTPDREIDLFEGLERCEGKLSRTVLR